MRYFDICIVDVGAISEGGDDGVGPLFNYREHVFSCLSKVVVGSDLWERSAVWEPVDVDSIPSAVEFGYETVEASVVVHGWFDVRTMNSMRGEGFTFIGCFVDKDFGAQRCKWCEIEVEASKYC